MVQETPITNQEESWGGETYETVLPKGVSTEFMRFKKALDRYPQQCIRQGYLPALLSLQAKFWVSSIIRNVQGTETSLLLQGFTLVAYRKGFCAESSQVSTMLLTVELRTAADVASAVHDRRGSRMVRF